MNIALEIMESAVDTGQNKYAESVVLVDVINRVGNEESAISINRWLTLCLKRRMPVLAVPLMDAVTAPLKEGSVESMEKSKYSRGAVLIWM